VDVTEIIATMFSNPQNFVVIAIQFLLGLALGYLSAKVLKYMLALIAILALGTLLSVWSLGTSPQEVIAKIGLPSVEILKGLAVVLGLMTVGPVSIGFIIGVVIAFLRK
jgi:hypothetical protein